MIKNFFSEDVKNAKNEIKNAQNKFNELSSRVSNEKELVKNRMIDELNQANAEAQFLSDRSGITDAKNRLDVAQQAYDRALRTTRRARTVATGIGAGATALAVSTNKSDTGIEENNQTPNWLEY